MGSNPLMPPGMPPLMPPGMPPVMSPGMPPIMPPGIPPHVHMGSNPLMSPGMPPVMSPGMPPVMSPGMPPGMGPNPDLPPYSNPMMSPGMFGLSTAGLSPYSARGGGSYQEFPDLNLDKNTVSKSTLKILPTFLNRYDINNMYHQTLSTFPSHIRGGYKVKGQKFPENFPKVVAYPLNRYDEFIKSIDHNKHFVYRIKKVIDFYLGICRKHRIRIPFESDVHDLLRSIHTNNNKYNNDILELQNISTIKVNKRDLSININDTKYSSSYNTNIKRQVDKVNNSRRILHTELKLLFSIEETLFNLVKYKLVKHYHK